VFVGSKHGMVYQVDYQSRALRSVFTCHESAILSLTLGAGLCLTGGADQRLRIWPLDFAEFLIEAKHEGALVCLDLSGAETRVVCATATSDLGVLDLSSQNYKTVLRSHVDEILQLEHHSLTNLLISLSKDLSIRLWFLLSFLNASLQGP